MKLKYKKKILPISLILLLIFSLLSPLIAGDIYRWPSWNNPEIEAERERTQNATFAWNVSEHFRDGSADENWNVSYNTSTGDASGTPWTVNDSRWNLNEYPGYTFGYSLMWNNSAWDAGGAADPRAEGMPFSWAIVNSSYTNRSQSIIFARTQNWTIDDGEIYYGFIFKANNTSGNNGGFVDNMTAVLYGPRSLYVLQYDNYTGVLRDVLNGTAVTTNDSIGLTNYYGAWIANYTFGDYDIEGFYNGTWIKTIYNSLCGNLQSKFWGNTSSLLTRLGLLDEPTGWLISRNLPNITTNDAVQCGLAVWNPNGVQAVIQFDTINVWRLNYTLNNSVDWSVAEGGRPHMNFPLINTSDINETLVDLFWAMIEGNISMDSITDFWIAFTNNLSMESRPYYVDTNGVFEATASAELQNDTTYYYSCVFTNFNEFVEDWFDGVNPFEGNPDDLLFLWVHDTAQKFEDPGRLNFLFISVDTDNDGDYDDHDRAFICSDVIYGTWTGLIPDPAPRYFYNDSYSTRGLQNLHRYNEHLFYLVMIPLTEFPHHSTDSGDYLKANDTFGLNIISSNEQWDNNICVWQNYNESNCSVHVNEESANAKQFYINASYIDHFLPLAIDSEHVERWGEGQIGWAAGEQILGNFAIDVLKSANVTVIRTGLNTTTQHIVNYSINISNTGTSDLTGIQINETWFECGCSDWNFTWMEQYWLVTNSGYEYNFTAWNRTWNNDSCYMLINLSNMTLSTGEYWNFSFNIDVRACINATRGTITNSATVTCDESGVTDTDNHEITYGITTLVRIQATTGVFDVFIPAETVTTIMGIVIIIASIMAIIGLVYKYVR